MRPNTSPTSNPHKLPTETTCRANKGKPSSYSFTFPPCLCLPQLREHPEGWEAKVFSPELGTLNIRPVDPQHCEGLQTLELIGVPRQSRLPSPHPLNASQLALVEDEIASLLDKRAIQELPHHCNLFYSNLFLVFRSFVHHNHFKMEDLKVVADSLRPLDFMCKINLKDAYFAVPIHPAHQKLLLLSVQECNLPALMPTLRSHFSTKSAEVPDSLCQETGCKDMYLPRRHANPKFSEGWSYERCIINAPPVGKSGVHCEYAEIYSIPFTGNGILRCSGQLHSHELFPPGKQSPEHPE